MSQENIADQLGISRQAVAKWESGKSEPTVANLAELASLFEMSISELIDTKKYAEERDVQTQKCDDKQRNSKMLFGRWGAVALINAGWNGYSSGLYGTPLLVSNFSDWSCYDFFHFLFATYHFTGTNWSKLFSCRHCYCNLRHYIKFEILAIYMESQIE